MDTDAVELSQLNLSVPEQVLLLGAVALIVFVPGLVVVLASAWSGPSLVTNPPDPGNSGGSGNRGSRLPFIVVAMAAAPAVTFGGTSLLTEVFADHEIRWNGTSFSWGFLGITVISVLVCGLLWAVSAAVLSRIRARRNPAGPEDSLDDDPHDPEKRRAAPGRRRIRWGRVLVSSATVVVVGLIAVLSTWSIIRAVGGLDTTVPTWDALFHSTAMRWIAENGQACSSCLAEVNEPENADPYYPSAYHAVSAIGILLTGWQMPGVYVAMIALTVGTFALGSAALVAEFGGGHVARIVAAVIAVIAPFFPTALVSYGQLAPFGMAVAVMPGVIAAVAAALRAPSPGSIPVVTLGIVGVAALHPSVGVFLLAVVALQGLGELVGRVFAVVSRRRGAEIPHRGSLGWAIVGGALTGVLLRWVVKTDAAGELEGFDWPAVDDIPGSTAYVVLLEAAQEPVRFLLLGLAVVGLIGILSWRPGLRRALPTVVVAGVAAYLAVLARGTDEQWAENLTQLWWNDWHRLAALSVIGWVVAAGAGAESLMRLAWKCGAAGAKNGRTGQRVCGVVTGSVLISASVLIAWFTVPERMDQAASGYIEDDRLVTDGELSAYEWLADNYDGGLVLNDPMDGSPWLYTIYGVPVTFNVPLAAGADAKHGEDRMLLYRLAHDAGVPGATYAQEAAEAIDELDVRWVILGPTWLSDREETAGGFLKLDESPAFDLVYDEDDVMIYEVDRELLTENPSLN